MVDEEVLGSGGNFEGDGGAFDEGDVVVDVADGGVEGYGVAVGGCHVGNHVFHGVVGVVFFVFGELSDDEAVELSEDSGDFELVEYAFDFVDGFGDVFDE